MAVNMEIRYLGRRKLRYRLFRIQNDIPVDPKDGLQEYFETQPDFDGWHNFNRTWDLEEPTKWPWKAVPLKKSAEEAWNDTLEELVQEFPTGSE